MLTDVGLLTSSYMEHVLVSLCVDMWSISDSGDIEF